MGILAGAVAAPLVGGLIGQEQARGQQRRADAAQRAALAQFAGIELPELQEQLYDFTPDMMPEFLGEYDPMLEQLTQQGPSAMEGISTDPRLEQAQMQALESLSEIGQAGLTPADLAAMRSMQRQVSQQEQSRQNAVMQEMARRGVGGSGMELAARLASSQQAADAAGDQSNELARMAQQRALEGITAAGSLGGNIRRQEFGEQSDTARAMDEIARFNAMNQQQVRARNVGAQQQAQLRNLQERQRLGEQRAGIGREQEMRRAQLPGQQFDRELNLASGRAGQYQPIAQTASQQAGRTADMWSGIGTGVGTGIAAFGNREKK